MTQFKTGDRVKVVRESASHKRHNELLSEYMRATGEIRIDSGSGPVQYVLLDGKKVPSFIPADMLELEEEK